MPINIPWGQEFSGGPLSWTRSSHPVGPGPTPGWGTKNPQAMQRGQRKRKEKKRQRNQTNKTQDKQQKEKQSNIKIGRASGRERV